MATEVRVPKLASDMESGTLIRWLKDEGDHVALGEPLYELDTDKVTQEVEAEADGVLRILAEPGEVYAVGATLAVIGSGAGDDVGP